MTNDLPSRRTVSAGLASATLAGPAIAQAASRPLLLDDASHLNATPVVRHWTARPRADRQFVDHLRAELKAATAAERPLAVGGARHSMGGQSLARDGTAVTLDSGWVEIDNAAGAYRAGAGTRWRDVIPALASAGFSPKVTQSNNDFTLGGTLGANAHGWAVPFGPFGSTVRSLRLMRADGEVIECSRRREPELFALVLGGYGLFGVVLDLTLDMVANRALEAKSELMESSQLGPRFARAVGEPDVHMAYGRLSVSRSAFLTEAILTTYRTTQKTPKAVGDAGNSAMGAAARQFYRAQLGSETWKQARWYAETQLAPRLQPTVVRRSDLISRPVSELANRDPKRTDILHEYFLPPARLEGFLAACRRIIRPGRPELLNVTLRYLAADTDSVLAYAPGPRVAAVMSFNQARTAADDRAMRSITEELITVALAEGGGFYLPYRLHARPDQLAAGYPRLAEFVAAKRAHDPRLLFRNTMWDRYFAAL